MMLGSLAVPTALAKSRGAAAATVAPVTYRFDAHVVAGPHAGSFVHGWVDGQLDSNGLFTATLKTAELAPLTPGCYLAPGSSVCDLAPSANMTGKVMGKVATFRAVGKGWTWVLAGAPTAPAGNWTGTLTQGSAQVGSWTLTPAAALHIDGGFKSDPKSKDRIALSGAIDVVTTADGRVIGTFRPPDLTSAAPTVITGYVNPNNAAIALAIPMGKKGTVLVTGWSRQGFGVLKWSGSFVGPAAGDFGTMAGQG
jgi:hypothetical protein